MVSLSPFKLLTAFLAVLLSSQVVIAASAAAHHHQDKVIAGQIGPDCLKGAKYEGKPNGKNLTIAGVPTYFTSPKLGSVRTEKVILFFSDVFGPFHTNNFILQDYFASQGFYVYGIDYFLGDPIGDRFDNPPPGFDLGAWIAKSTAQAAATVPKWTQAVFAKHSSKAKFSATGYCFGGPYAMEAGANPKFTSVAFAHPSGLLESHFTNVTRPVLLTCAETDSTFPTESQRRAVDILVEKKASYHLDVYSGVAHGFATRADPADSNAVWAKDDAARSVVGWFNRFA